MRGLKYILVILCISLAGNLAQAQYLTYPDANKQKKEVKDTVEVIAVPQENMDSLARVLAEQARVKDSIERAKRAANRRRIRSSNDEEDTIVGMWAFPVDSALMDSLLNAQSTADTVKEKKERGLYSRDRDKIQKNWVFVISIILLGIVSISRVLNPRVFEEGFRSVFDWRRYTQLFNDTKTLYMGYNLRYMVFSNLMLSMMITVGLDLAGFDILGNDYRLFLLVFLGVSVIYLLKYLSHLLLADMLEIEDFGQSNVQYSIFYNFTQALIMLPIVLISYYNIGVLGDEIQILYMYAYLFFGLLIVRVLLNTLLNKSYFPFSIFYLFIYLCVLEILPVFVGIKAVLNII